MPQVCHKKSAVWLAAASRFGAADLRRLQQTCVIPAAAGAKKMAGTVPGHGWIDAEGELSPSAAA